MDKHIEKKIWNEAVEKAADVATNSFLESMAYETRIQYREEIEEKAQHMKDQIMSLRHDLTGPSTGGW